MTLNNKWNLVIPEIPWLQNYPRAATIVRGGLLVAAVFITGTTIGFLNAKGFDATYATLFLPILVPSTLVAALTFLWNVGRKNATIKEWTDHVLEATLTGQVPEAVKAQSTPQQLVKIAAVETEKATVDAYAQDAKK